MFKPENKIIIVDDNQEHLNVLSKPFYDNGIGCRSFLYDVGYDSPLQSVRVAFFDIRINPAGGGSEGQRLNEIATAIKQYIHVDNGPFALIFWTSNKDDIDDIKEHIDTRHPDCPRPFLVNYIDKGDFLANPENLTAKLKDVLGDNILRLLFEFENASIEAASLTLNQLYQSVQVNNDRWGQSDHFKDEFNTIFSRIAISTMGFSHAKENPDVAIKEALLPMLGHHLLNSSVKSESWKGALTKLAAANSLNDVPKIPQNNQAVLNTIFHVDTSNNVAPVSRGAVLIYQFYPQEANRFNYFKKLQEESHSLFARFIQFSEVAGDDEKARLIADSIWVAIEISSACDFSQNKPRNHKYVLGILTPNIELNKIATSNIGEAVFYKDIPVFMYEGQEMRLWINFNFSFSDFETNERLGKPLFQLKKELMDLIGNRYANHLSRIGITSF